MQEIPTAAFAGLVDLAAERVGGVALRASDEFFAEKENLLKPGRGVFIPDKYTDRGKWMDGWESRRKRTPGHDWCVIQLGLPGIIKGVDIDTNHFLGNHPPYASIDGVLCSGQPSVEDVMQCTWREILGKSPLRPGSQNLFAIEDGTKISHIRLNIYPDGGVARLRVYGVVTPGWSSIETDQYVDLAAMARGGSVVACSDMFFGAKDNLILPGRPINMGDGWETRRRRGSGYDWAVVKLGTTGTIHKVEIDTCHFKGNYPDRCSLFACHSPDTAIDCLNVEEISWTPILPQTKLEADKQHYFATELQNTERLYNHVRLNIFPDGGVGRLRILGKPADREIK